MSSHVPVLVLFIPAPLPHDVKVFVWDRGPWLVTYLVDEQIMSPTAALLLQAAVNAEAVHWTPADEPGPTPTSIRLVG